MHQPEEHLRQVDDVLENGAPVAAQRFVAVGPSAHDAHWQVLSISELDLSGARTVFLICLKTVTCMDVSLCAWMSQHICLLTQAPGRGMQPLKADAAWRAVMDYENTSPQDIDDIFFESGSSKEGFR